MNKLVSETTPISEITESEIKAAVSELLLMVYKEVEKITGPMEGSYIAGGAISSILLGETPKDYDFWFENPEDFQKAQDGIAREQFSGLYTERIESKYATTLVLASGKKIQLVQSRMGVPEVVVPTFDFLHTQSYMKRDGTLVTDIDFIREKKLVYVPGNFSHPVNTMQRVNKFARRGYDIPFETIRDLMVACTGLDPETIGKSDRHTGSL